MYKFSGLIKCLNCGGKYRGKMQRNKKVYVCSTYNKQGASACARHILTEDDLEYTVSKHLAIMNRRIEGSMGEHIHTIEVKGKGYTIYYRDGSKSIISDDQNEYGVKIKY